MTPSQRPQSDILPLTHSTYAAQLFHTSLFSDCTIYSKHRVWHLHRCILSPRCEFFWSCFQGSFEEASTSTIEMHDDDPETLERMLRWIYMLEYPSFKTEVSKRTSWTKDLMLYMMADKYNLSALMEATRQALIDGAVRSAHNSATMVETVEDFVDAMQMLYVELPERDDLIALQIELLSILAPAIAKHMRDLPILEELMTTIPGFGVGLVESLAQQKQDRRRSSSSIESNSVGSGVSSSRSRSNSPQYTKPYIPLNEDSEDELE